MAKAGATDKPLIDKNIQPDAAGTAEIRRLLHQFNQPLTAINNYAQAGSQLIANGQGDLALLKDLFDKIAAQCSRTCALSEELGKSIAQERQARDA